MAATRHPLDPLSAEEINVAVAALRASGDVPDSAVFTDVELMEPDKQTTHRHLAADPAVADIDRRAVLTVLTGPEMTALQAVVSTASGEIVSTKVLEEVCPSISLVESLNAVIAVKSDPAWQEAIRRRGITDFDVVDVDPWPAGRFGLPMEVGRRLARCTSYLREVPTDNAYARPIDGVIAFVDLGRAEVLEVEDHGVVPIPPRDGGYRPADVGPLRQDLQPIEITQPQGPSFGLDGHVLSWQRWSMHVSMSPHEGVVLHCVSYRDQGRERPVLYRASVNEMVVPYGDPGPMHGWKNAFDASEWGLGKAANSLELGCDCLGEIRYLDATFANEQGEAYTLPNAVCIHEEDFGIGWKHVDLANGTSEVRRSRRLVVSWIVTAGNYEYGFYWYFYLDGAIQLEVKLTGVVSTVAAAAGAESVHAERVTKDLWAPHHQHLFNVRLDFDVDGTDNSVYEMEVERRPSGPDNPLGGAFAVRSTLLATEQAAQRTVLPERSRAWKIVNRRALNAVGEPVAYKLVPGAAPTLLAQPDSSIARRAAFATRNLWVTPYSPLERRAAGEHPNQHPGGDGLPRWTEADRSLVDTDIVVWYTFGVTHVVRPEDFPVMPVETASLSLVPAGFFDRNPALDVPPSPHCGVPEQAGGPVGGEA